jgi:hypothetical protein
MAEPKDSIEEHLEKVMQERVDACHVWLMRAMSPERLMSSEVPSLANIERIEIHVQFTYDDGHKVIAHTCGTP